MDPELIAKARKLVRSRLGAALEAKASDLMVLALVQQVQAALEEAGGPSATTVIEIEPDTAQREQARALGQVVRTAPGWDSVNDMMPEPRTRMAGARGPRAPGQAARSVRAEAMVSRAARQMSAASARASFMARTADIRATLQQGRGPSWGLEAAQGSGGGVEVCWLNETMRTRAEPDVLAGLADAEHIRRFDVGRQIQPEELVSTTLVGAPAYRDAYSVTGEDIIIAIIDSEVELDHSAFAGRIRHMGNYTNEPFGNPARHGTAVAGIAASGDPANPGVAPGASIYCYKVISTNIFKNADDFGGSMAIQQALEDGALVANCSWGVGAARDGSSREARACDAAWELGMAVVKSAGNKGPDTGTLTSPADAEGIIVVGSCDSSGAAVARYSSRGPVGDGRLRPHLLAPGGDEDVGLPSTTLGGGIGNVGWGTSFAAPLITGLVALLLDQGPELTPAELRDTLLQACRKIPGISEEAQGAGVVWLGG